MGDVLVVVSGGKVPYLLRPVLGEEQGLDKRLDKVEIQHATAVPGTTSSTGHSRIDQKYEFIGECFVMSAMSGRYYEMQVRRGGNCPSSLSYDGFSGTIVSLFTELYLLHNIWGVCP